MTTTFQRSENGLNWRPDTTGETFRLINLLFVGAEIATFEFWADFVLRVERNNLRRDLAIPEVWGDLRIPPVFGLRLANTWWVGDRAEWEDSLERFPIKAPDGIAKEVTLQASTAVRLIRAVIKALEISEQGDLNIRFRSNEQLHVTGAGGKWEESWMFELPVDDPDRDKWSITCDSVGTVYAKWPQPTYRTQY